MRFIENTNINPIKRTRAADERLRSWLNYQITDGLAKRKFLDILMRELMRQYSGITNITDRKGDRSSQPPLIEIPLGATQCDSIVSTVTEIIFNTSPVFTVRASPGYSDHAAAFQLLVDKILLDKFTNIHEAAADVIGDTVQMGTGAYYVPITEERVKRVRGVELSRGPRVFSVACEDLVVPGGASTDINELPFIAHRLFYNDYELAEAARVNNWTVSDFKPTGNVDWVRQRRDAVAHTAESSADLGNLYEIFNIYCYFDYDNDGLAEDLHVIWDRTSQAIGYVGFAPYDSRPYSISRYQHRPYIFYGIGVLEMAFPFQTEVTEWHNFKMKNAHLSNARFWAYRLGAPGVGEKLEISPNNIIGLANPREDLVAIQMADVYQSAQQYEAATLALAERRVGTNELAAPPIAMGRRMPATTAMALLQRENKRFAAPFNNIRAALADVMTQCVMRYREQYRRGGRDRQAVIEYLVSTVGLKNTTLIEEVFQNGTDIDLRDRIIIEITASSATVNREADKQQAIMLVNVLSAYYEKLLATYQLVANPQIPPDLKQLALSVIKSSSRAVEKMLRTFDNVRDPDAYIPKLPDEAAEGTAIGQPAPAEGAPEMGAPAANGPAQPIGEFLNGLGPNQSAAGNANAAPQS